MNERRMNSMKVSALLLVLVLEFVSSRTLLDPFKLEMQNDEANCTKADHECTTSDECCLKTFGCYPRYGNYGKMVCRGPPPVEVPTPPPHPCGGTGEECWSSVDCCTDQGYLCDLETQKCVNTVFV